MQQYYLALEDARKTIKLDNTWPKVVGKLSVQIKCDFIASDLFLYMEKTLLVNMNEIFIKF